MTNTNTCKFATAGSLSKALVAGDMPANVGGFLTESMGIPGSVTVYANGDLMTDMICNGLSLRNGFSVINDDSTLTMVSFHGILADADRKKCDFGSKETSFAGNGKLRSVFDPGYESQIMPAVIVNDVELTSEDFDVAELKDEHGNAVTAVNNAGTYSVTIRGKGKYTGSKALTWKVEPLYLSAGVLCVDNVVYADDTVDPDISIAVGNKKIKLQKGIDYTISQILPQGEDDPEPVSCIFDAGEYVFYIHGMGNYLTGMDIPAPVNVADKYCVTYSINGTRSFKSVV